MFSHDLNICLDAFEKSYESALANYAAAAALADLKHLSQATSLSILSLEEVGKMMLIDGLLFARIGDECYKNYKQGYLKHRMKLNAVELYPLFLHYLSTIDPRRDEARFNQTLRIAIDDLKKKRQNICEILGNNFTFSDLDALKQKGFYSHEDDRGLKSNVEAIDHNLAKAVLALSWRVTDTLKFMLNCSLEKYRESFQELRKKNDEFTLARVRNEANKLVQNIFNVSGDP